MQLEAGKFYMNGHGDVCGPMEERTPGTWLDQHGGVYRPNGRGWNHTHDSAANLGREVSQETVAKKIPMKPGYYWAKLRVPADGTHEAELWGFNDTWEIVQVNANSAGWDDDPDDDEALSVAVPGIRETQWRECFVWGEFVAPLEPKNVSSLYIHQRQEPK